MTPNYDSSLLLDESEINDIKESAPQMDDFISLAEIYKILSDPTRLKIIFALLKHEMCVSDLVKILAIPQSTISHALANFRALNLVRYRKEGSLILYALSDDHVEDIFAKGLEHIQEKNI